MIDLDAYLARLGYDGPRAATREVLAAICSAQPRSIAFETLDPFTGRVPQLSPAALQAKLVDRRRGGYCYELNLLLREALLALGMQVTGLSARVVWRAPRDTPPRPRSHMLLMVEMPEARGERHLADAGFGGYLLGAPLALAPDVEQATPEGRLRIMTDAGEYQLEVALPGGWEPVYRFTLDAQQPADYEPVNWFNATHPRSLFANNLMVERLAPQGRASLLNDRLTLQAPGQPSQVRRIADPEELARVLDQVFDIEPPLPARELFERIPKGLDGPLLPQPR